MAFALLLSSAAACSETEVERAPTLTFDAGQDGGSVEPPPGEVDAGLPELDGAAQQDGGISQPDGDFLGLAPPARGFRLQTKGRMIPAKTDQEFCEVAELPGEATDEYIVNRLEAANRNGSHHLIVLVAPPGSAADKSLQARQVGSQTPCLSPNVEFGEGLVSIIGSQTPHADVKYPDGVAIKLRGKQRVVFDYHYFNYTDAPVEAKSAIAVHAVEAATIKNIAGGFAFTNMTIDTPPLGKGTFVAECTFQRDMLVHNVTRHTHAQSTDFSVWLKGGARDGQLIWTSHDWEHDLSHEFPEPTLVKAGEGFRFSCGFENKGNKPLRFGTAAKDEMCILAGAIWPTTPSMEAADESCLITWVDENGIGHDARDNGGFPKPSLEEMLSCHATAFGFGFINSCVGCICDSCGAIMSRCYADPDCRPILECRTTCDATKENCDEKCEPLMFEHSSAVGMITQVGVCNASKCGEKCAP